jgi:hypothetical protein
MEMILSRLAATPSLKQVFAVIKVVGDAISLYTRLPVTIATKINAALESAVEFVLLRSDVTKIAPSVVGSISVDMVNFNGLLSGHQKVSDTVGKKPVVINRYLKVSSILNGSAFSPKLARFGVIFEDFFNRVGYKFRSHVESPLSVVRGLVTAITSTPILTQRYSHV